MNHHYVAQLVTGRYRRSLCRIYHSELDAWLDAEELVREGEVIEVYRREPGGIWSLKRAWASYVWEDCDSEDGRRMERLFDDLIADDAQGFFEELRRAA